MNKTFLVLIFILTIGINLSIINCGGNEDINEIIPKNINDSSINNNDKNSDRELDETELFNNIFSFNDSKTKNVNSKNKISERYINSLIGITRFYGLIINKNASLTKDEISLENQNPVLNYDIDYDKIYPTKNKLPEEIPYCRITYDLYNNPIKMEYFNEDNRIIYLNLFEYNSKNELITEKEYNSSFNLVMRRDYHTGTGKIKSEKLYDDFGNLLYTRLFSYNSLNLLIQETLLDNNNLINEYSKFSYNKGLLKNESFYSADGILQTEIFYNEHKNPIKINYYKNGNKINYQELTEYYNDGKTMRLRKDIDEEGNILSETYYDKDAYQKKVISYYEGVKETKIFNYTRNNESKILDKMEVYIGDSTKPQEYTSYFYDDVTGEINNWITYNTEGKVIDSMDSSNIEY